MAPTVRAAIGAACLLRIGDDVEVLIDFPAGEVRPYAGDEHHFRFEIDRPLVEAVVAERAVDWSNSLFLSCRFRAWRDGEFNEWVYNFFKSLSTERMRRTEAEAVRRLDPPTETEPDIELDGWIVQRRCPHRNADLAVFGEIDGLHADVHPARLALRPRDRALPHRGRPPDPRATRCRGGLTTGDRHHAARRDSPAAGATRALRRGPRRGGSSASGRSPR